MSAEHRVVLADSTLEDLLKAEGTPLEDLPIGDEERQALLVNVNNRGPNGSNPAGPIGRRWVCYPTKTSPTGPGGWVCFHVP
jgi:hypothetical protein